MYNSVFYGYKVQLYCFYFLSSFLTLLHGIISSPPWCESIAIGCQTSCFPPYCFEHFIIHIHEIVFPWITWFMETLLTDDVLGYISRHLWFTIKCLDHPICKGHRNQFDKGRDGCIILSSFPHDSQICTDERWSLDIKGWCRLGVCFYLRLK